MTDNGPTLPVDARDLTSGPDNLTSPTLRPRRTRPPHTTSTSPITPPSSDNINSSLSDAYMYETPPPDYLAEHGVAAVPTNTREAAVVASPGGQQRVTAPMLDTFASYDFTPGLGPIRGELRPAVINPERRVKEDGDDQDQDHGVVDLRDEIEEGIEGRLGIPPGPLPNHSEARAASPAASLDAGDDPVIVHADALPDGTLLPDHRNVATISTTSGDERGTSGDDLGTSSDGADLEPVSETASGEITDERYEEYRRDRFNLLRGDFNRRQPEDWREGEPLTPIDLTEEAWDTLGLVDRSNRFNQELIQEEVVSNRRNIAGMVHDARITSTQLAELRYALSDADYQGVMEAFFERVAVDLKVPDKIGILVDGRIQPAPQDRDWLEGWQNNPEFKLWQQKKAEEERARLELARQAAEAADAERDGTAAATPVDSRVDISERIRRPTRGIDLLFQDLRGLREGATKLMGMSKEELLGKTLAVGETALARKSELMNLGVEGVTKVVTGIRSDIALGREVGLREINRLYNDSVGAKEPEQISSVIELTGKLWSMEPEAKRVFLQRIWSGAKSGFLGILTGIPLIESYISEEEKKEEVKD